MSFAILFIYILGFKINVEEKLERIINLLNTALINLGVDISDIILIRNLIFYSDIVDKKLIKHL